MTAGTLSTKTADLTHVIADYARSTSVDQLPEDVRERGRLILMDELACAAFGQTRTPGALGTAYARRVGGAGACRILGTSYLTTAPYAAFANGTAGHADEVDGAHVVGGHPGATIVHAVAAASGDRRATGADLLNAVVLGYEIGTRLIRACGSIFSVKSRLHLHADFLHAVGAAVAVCRILGLDVEGHVNAMALSTFQANGLIALFHERRHISKSLCNGQYAFAGVSAAYMADAGLEGCDNILAGDRGLLDAWGVDGGEHALTDGLGTEHAVMGANFKFINAGYPIHSVVEAAVHLLGRTGVSVDDIAEVDVGMPSNALHVVDNRAMHNICVQDMLAAALVGRGLPVEATPFPQLLSDPAFHAVRSRINAHPDADLDARQPDGRGARVTLTLRDGSQVIHLVEQPRGHSRGANIGWDDLRQKWTAALPGCDVDRLIQTTRSVEDLDDVDSLLRLFDPVRP